jgi:hypothetical protein
MHRPTIRLGRQAWPLYIVLAVACARQIPQPPPPPFTGAVILQIPIDSIRAYAERVRFDSVPPGAHEAGIDFEHARLGGDNLTRIEPAVTLCLLDSFALASGRIVARLRSARPHPPLGPGWTYAWMDRFGAGNTWRTVFIGTDTRTVRPVATHDHPWEPGVPQVATFREASAGDTALIQPCWCCPWGWCGTILVATTRTALRQRH